MVSATEIMSLIQKATAEFNFLNPERLADVKKTLLVCKGSIPFIAHGDAARGLTNAINSFVKRINRRLGELAESSKPVMVHNYVASAEIKSRDINQYLDYGTDAEFLPLVGGPGKITALEIKESFKNVLVKREAALIQDSVFNFARRLSEGEDVPMRLDGDGKYYILTTTFDDFCRSGGISGDDRGKVKAAILTGLLDQVPFHIVKDGKPYYVEKRYISRRTTAKGPRRPQAANLPNLPPANPDQLDGELSFELDIDAELFQFIHARGKGNVGAGFLRIPQQLTSKIDRVFEHVRYWITEGKLDQVDQLHRQAFEALTNPDSQKLRPAIIFIIQRWEATRKTRGDYPLIVSWADLSGRKILPMNDHHPGDRKRDMIGLWAALGSMIEFGDLWTPSMEVRLDPAGLEMTIFDRAVSTLPLSGTRALPFPPQ